MIERKFVQEKLKEFQIEEYVSETLKRVGHSKTKVVRTPLGEKVIIYAVRPGLVVGKKGENIKKLTRTLKTRFGLENPQVEIAEIPSPDLDPKIVAEKISSTMEQFGSSRFKAIGHKAMQDVMNAGGLGIEILVSGKVPSQRAKRWRFYQGYLKKCGDVAQTQILQAYSEAQLKSGTVGIQVRIMPPDVELPDKVIIKSVEDAQQSTQKEAEEKAAKEQVEAEEKPKKKAPRKRGPRKKKETKAEEKSEDAADKDEQ
jgi:small subunit ribosomal protein S3